MTELIKDQEIRQMTVANSTETLHYGMSDSAAALKLNSIGIDMDTI